VAFDAGNDEQSQEYVPQIEAELLSQMSANVAWLTFIFHLFGVAAVDS
jgi:hypothetical protein